MAALKKSQWDFGDLFSGGGGQRQVLSVGQITSRVRKLLEQNWASVWVEGEITNLRAQSSGHYYFSLKDSQAQIQCVCFKTDAAHHRGVLQDGRAVLVHGGLSVYEPRGQYQLIVRQIEARGAGQLQAAFEQLREKLRLEGLFDTSRKRPVTPYVRRIGLVTSPSGAAIQDVLHAIQRRNPALEVILAPCRVQGSGAAAEVARAIESLNQFALNLDKHLDAILVVRGGGSLEDLWAFNEEVVARAVANSRVPIVSGVGHEVDFTICDMVADVRAATPTAAAELVTEGMLQAREKLAIHSTRLGRLVRSTLAGCEESIEGAARRLAASHPRRKLEARSQRLDDLLESLHQHAKYRLRESRLILNSMATTLARRRPRVRLEIAQGSVGELAKELANARRRQLETAAARLKELGERVRLLSPQTTLQRGFSITRRTDTGEILRSADEIVRGQELETVFKDGSVRSVASGTSAGHT